MSAPLLPTQFLLYGNDHYDSHVVHFLLAEKGLSFDFIDTPHPNEDLFRLNPYGTLPVLVGKEITLYEVGVIIEYLEERHLSSKLLPDTPKERAMVRTLAWRIQKDWLSLGRILMTHPDSLDAAAAAAAKKTLSDTLLTISPLFGQKPYFLSEQFGLCDLWLVPFLWRLPALGIELPAHLCRPLIAYQERLFTRPSFVQTLTKTKPNEQKANLTQAKHKAKAERK